MKKQEMKELTAAADGGSVPPHLVAEIENSLQGESPDGNRPEEVEGALDAGQCPEELIAGIEETYSADDDDDDEYDTDGDE